MARNRTDEERYREWRKRARQGGPDGDGGVGRVSDVRDEFLADRASPVRQLIGTAAGLSDASGSPFAAFGDANTGQVVGEPTGSARYKPTGVPGLFMDTVLGKTVGRDLRPVKDFVYESRDGAVVNLETGEQVRPGGSAGKVKDRYQGPVVKMTTGTVNVRSTGRSRGANLRESGGSYGGR